MCVNGTCAPAATSNTAALTVTASPTITSEPLSVTSCIGTNASFYITATGGELTYQWQSNINGMFENLSNSGVYNNVTTNTLIITDVSGLDSTYYRCIASNTTCSVTSDNALLRVVVSSTISVQPSPVTTCTGNSVSFSVTATGSSITYQWQSLIFNNGQSNIINLTDGGVYSNVTNATMNISNDAGLNGTYYQCIVTGCDLSPITSDSVLLTVSTVSPAIITEPEAITSCTGDSISFNITAAGGELTYQWQSSPNGVIYTNLTNTGVFSGVSTDIIKITNVAGLNNYQFRCIVSGICAPAATSSAARLTVNTSPTIYRQPTAVSTCVGNAVTFRVTAAGGGFGAGLIYQWQSNVSGTFENLTNGGVFSNVATATMTISNDTGLDSTYYRCIASNANCSSTSDSVLLSVFDLPEITNQPVSVDLCSGSGTTFSVVASGGALSYQWQSNAGGAFQNINNGGVYRGVATATVRIGNVTGLNGTSFRCIVSGCDSLSSTSNAAILHVGTNPPAITSQPKNIAQCTGGSVQFTTAATGDFISYQWQSSPNGTAYTNLSNTGGYSQVTTDSLEISNVAGLNNTHYRCIVSGTCAPEATSSSAILTVNQYPVISVEPATVSSCIGNSAVFSITATGGTFIYQWQILNPESLDFTNLSNTGVQ